MRRDCIDHLVDPTMCRHQKKRFLNQVHLDTLPIIHDMFTLIKGGGGDGDEDDDVVVNVVVINVYALIPTDKFYYAANSSRSTDYILLVECHHTLYRVYPNHDFMTLLSGKEEYISDDQSFMRISFDTTNNSVQISKLPFHSRPSKKRKRENWCGKKM